MIRIYNFIFNKLPDLFPVGGGIGGALSQANKVEELSHFPRHEIIITTIIIAAIGAAVGFLVQLLFNFLFRKFKNRYKI